MAKQTFFDLLKEKLSEVSPPIEQHKQQDWASLDNRLNKALPKRPDNQRRGLILPLLLFAAMLSSNAVWWHIREKDQNKLVNAEARITTLQASVMAMQSQTMPIKTDTVWKIIYVQAPAVPSYRTVQYATGWVKEPVQKDMLLPSASTDEKGGNLNTLTAIFQKDKIDTTRSFANIPLIATLNLALLRRTNPHLSAYQVPESPVMHPIQPDKSAEQQFLDAIHPKYLKLGIQTGLLYAKSSGLMHEGGFSCGIQGEIGLSRHWAVIAGMRMGKLHYKAHTPLAILGAPNLPMLPSTAHHFSELDVTGQRIRQFDMGARYIFRAPGQIRPFVGLSWGALTVLPYTVEYEIQHEATGLIEKGAFDVTSDTRLANNLRLGAGLDIPFFKRVDLRLEGFYGRQWHKPTAETPDLTGVRAGLDWRF